MRKLRKPFNVTLIHPATYVHSLALKEAADYVYAALLACGYPAARTTNQLGRNAHNIIFCAHMLGRAEAGRIPPDSIIFNSEQLDDTAGWHLRGGLYRDLLARFWVWDYSQNNLSRIAHARKFFIPFQYRPELLRADIPREAGTVLLFYGVLTPRRKRILEELHRRGIRIEVLFGQYGNERDARIRRAWGVLNIHKHDETSAFEPIRCFYPLINEVPVISEEVDDSSADAFRDSMFFFDRASLLDGIQQLYADPPAFGESSRAMLTNFRKLSPLPSVAAAAERFLESW
jgi:hypothetical protein